MEPWAHGQRQVRADYDDTTITVYQAFNDEIASAALTAGRFVAPFNRNRMTWIKPSFLWVMYRSGWATKSDQNRILAVTIARSGFEWALGHSCPSQFDPSIHASWSSWKESCASTPVRVQWDPERDLHLRALPYRSLQVGLRGEAVDRYIGNWISGIRDVTALAHEIREAVDAGNDDAAMTLLPEERPYPLPEALGARIASIP